MTIPIIPWINSTSAWNCSFPVSVYGAQQSTNPYVHPNGDNCGNSISMSGAQLDDTNITANHVANAPATQQAWVSHMAGKFGHANAGGVMFYQLDNEPGGWGNTHRDVEPGGVPYSDTISDTTTIPGIVSLGQAYAAAVKAADPSALVLGPSDFTLGGWIGTPAEQDGLLAGQYYLQQMATNAQNTGRRVLDYFDEHYYFDTSSVVNQLASTRTLWDPTYNSGTWVEQYYFHGPMMLVPRFKQWIAQYYPGTKLAISEYSIDSGAKAVTDAIAEADVLGIFGREAVDLAAMWGAQAATASGYVLTLVLINKTPNALTTTVSVANPAPTGSADLYSYTGRDLRAIHENGSVVFKNGSATVTLPGYSMHMLVLPLK